MGEKLEFFFIPVLKKEKFQQKIHCHKVKILKLKKKKENE
jgi:hypothetical protein